MGALKTFRMAVTAAALLLSLPMAVQAQTTLRIGLAEDGAGFAGSVVWQALPWNGLGRDRNYDFSLSDDGGYEIRAHAKVMNAMSGYEPNSTST